MCCRLSVYPLDKETAIAILKVGQFEEQNSFTWMRNLPDEGTTVYATFGPSALELHINPAVSHYAQHLDKRVAASVYFEIAAKYAEKVGGTIIQRANVVGCLNSDYTKPSERTLAQYPDVPMLWQNVCPGFQETLFGNKETE